MNIYIMDSDYEVMKTLESLINNYPNYITKCFTSYQRLVDAVRKVPPDIALVGIDSSGGLSAVNTIQSESINTRIIIMSEEREKVSEYFKLRANGFLTKPIGEENLKEQLFRVNHPLLARIKYGCERTATV